MLVEGIKSRPQYPGLEPDPGARRHLIAAEGEGALVVADLFAAAPDGFAARATILYTPGGSAPADHPLRLAALAADIVQTLPSIATLLVRLNANLANATMGTRLYATGTEGFIGQVMQLALAHDIDHRSVLTEHRGSRARRVQCVHCKGITEGVTTSIAACAHCGLGLLVRDHYSRRLGAFMGVAADAEAPGEPPAVTEPFR